MVTASAQPLDEATLRRQLTDFYHLVVQGLSITI
jgi:hypothetical protein